MSSRFQPLPLKGRLSCYLLAALVSRRGCVSHKAELSVGAVHPAAGLSVPFARLYRIFPAICLCRMRLRTSRGTLWEGVGGHCLAYREKRGAHASDIRATTDVELEKRRKVFFVCFLIIACLCPVRRKVHSPFSCSFIQPLVMSQRVPMPLTGQ